MAVVVGPGGSASAAAQLTAEDAPDHLQGVGLDPPAGEPAAGGAEHAALLEVERGERTLLVAAAGAHVEHRVEALEREQLEEERRAHQRGGMLGEGAQRPHEHPVQRGVGLALLGDLIGGLEHRHRVGEAAVVLAQRPVGVDGLGLGDDVELATPVALHRDVRHRLEPRPEPAPGLAHALGHGADLPVPLRHDGDDPVGLPQLDRAQHDPLVPVQVHYISVVLPSRVTPARYSIAPKRRSRRWYSATASKRSARRKSAQQVSVKTNSE